MNNFFTMYVLVASVLLPIAKILMKQMCESFKVALPNVLSKFWTLEFDRQFCVLTSVIITEFILICNINQYSVRRFVEP